MQFSGLHKLVNAKKASEEHKTAKKQSPISASSVSEQYSKEKAKVDNDPYASALNIINQRQHDAVPDIICTSVEMRSVEENKSANNNSGIENTYTINLHEQESVQSPTEINDSNNEDRFCKKPRCETELPLNESNFVLEEIKLPSSHTIVNLETEIKANTENKEHITGINDTDNNGIISSSSKSIVMTQNEVDELRHAAIVNLTKIINKILLQLMTKYNSTNSNDNISACNECNAQTSDNIIIELLSQFISEHDLTFKQGAYDDENKAVLLHLDKLSQWMMTNEDKREFELLNCITKTAHLGSFRSQKVITELNKETKEVDDDESANNNSTESTQKIFRLEKLIRIL